DRPPGDPEVGRIGSREDDAEVVEAPDVLELAREGVDGPERRDEEDAERSDVDDEEPEERRREQRERLHPWPPPEGGGETKAGSPERGARPYDVDSQLSL